MKLIAMLALAHGALGAAEMINNAFIFFDRNEKVLFMEFQGHFYELDAPQHSPMCPCVD
jgi:hypothetical protein